jgi:hypothetical protein
LRFRVGVKGTALTVVPAGLGAVFAFGVTWRAG